MVKRLAVLALLCIVPALAMGQDLGIGVANGGTLLDPPKLKWGGQAILNCGAGMSCSWDAVNRYWTLSSVSAPSAAAMDSLTSPTGNYSVDMKQYTYRLNWTVNSGAGNLWSFTDFATNTGTGYLFTISTGVSSTIKPLRVCYRGASNCFVFDTNESLPLLSTSGTAKIDATKLLGNLPALNGASLTNVNAATLGGATFAAPGTIGDGTPGVATFTTLNGRNFSATPTTDSVTAVFRRNGAAQTARLIEFQTEANAFLSGITKAGSFEQTGVTDGCASWTSGVLGSTGTACGAGSGIGGSGTIGKLAKFVTNTTTIGDAAASDVVALFNSGTCSGYLKSDGTCATPSGAGSAGLSTAVQTSDGASGFSDSGCTASSGAMSCSSYASTGTGGIDFSEEAAPTGAASHTIVWNDSTSHRLKGNANNGGATTYAVFTDKLSVFAATSSSELAGVISDEQGSGALVFATSPTLTTPVLGVATATSINKMAITAPATSSTLAVADGKTFTASNTITLTGTDSTSFNVTTAKTRAIAFSIGSPTASGALTTSDTAYVTVPFACTISAYNLLFDAGDATAKIKFWKVATGTAIPTSAASINTSGVGVSTGTAIHSTTLTDFTSTSVSANDIIAMNLSTANTVKYVQGVLQCDQ